VSGLIRSENMLISYIRVDFAQCYFSNMDMVMIRPVINPLDEFRPTRNEA